MSIFHKEEIAIEQKAQTKEIQEEKIVVKQKIQKEEKQTAFSKLSDFLFQPRYEVKNLNFKKLEKNKS